MSANNIQNEDKKLVNDIAIQVLELLTNGYSKEQIFDYFVNELEKYNIDIEKNQLGKLIATITVTLSDAIDKVNLESIGLELKKVMKQMLKEEAERKYYSYIGKDGKDYYTKDALDFANQEYMDRMYSSQRRL
ncbi:MAG: hypothetical protein E7159_00420 [Firmicutes bacterium]|nr:hypothetical protein [Bacillota bacterium]